MMGGAQDTDTLVRRYIEGDRKVRDAVNTLDQELRPDKGILSSDLEMSYADRQRFKKQTFSIEEEIIAGKVGSPVTKAIWVKWCNDHNKTIPYKIWRELIELDEWDSEIKPNILKLMSHAGPEGVA